MIFIFCGHMITNIIKIFFQPSQSSFKTITYPPNILISMNFSTAMLDFVSCYTSNKKPTIRHTFVPSICHLYICLLPPKDILLYFIHCLIQIFLFFWFFDWYCPLRFVMEEELMWSRHLLLHWESLRSGTEWGRMEVLLLSLLLVR